MRAATPLPENIAAMRAKVLPRAAEVAAAAEERGQASGTERHILFRTTPEDSSALRYKERPAPLPWVFENFGLLGTAGLISAAGGVGKTWLEFILAAMARTGSPLLGDNLRPVRTGRTVSFFPEDPELIKHQRMRAMCDALGGSVDEDFLLEGIYAPELYGESMALVVKGAKGFETTPAFDAVVDYVKRCPDVVCVILDPLNLLHGVDLESDPAAAQYFASRMAFLARETNTFVIVAHHSTKGEIDADKFKLETALHVNTVRGTGATMGGFRIVLTLAALPEKYAKGKFGLAEKPAPGEYVAARIAKNNYGPMGKPFFLRKDMETGMLHPVRPATKRVESIEKTLVLSRFIPLIVKEVADQEAQGKRFTKATFAAIYNKTWKSAGDEEASRSTLAAAIERALVDGALRTVMLPRENGKEAPYLTAEGVVPVGDDTPWSDPDSWINGSEGKGGSPW